MYKISRNEKCWCGSGKKYKQCHERSDKEHFTKLNSKGHNIFPDRRLILSSEQIDGIRKSAEISVKILDGLNSIIKEGISTQEINDYVYKTTIEAGARPATLGYNGFPKSVCTSVNDVICHGIPGKRILKDGDIINVDVTTILNGYYSDTSRMYLIGNVSDEAKKLAEAAKECLKLGIEAVKPYAPISDIGEVIENYADKCGYSVVRAYCGHGVGLKFHEQPTVQHFKTDCDTMIMLPNMVFTIEPMINQGSYDYKILDDGWTAVTKDGLLSAQWEHTILVTENGAEILTA